MRSERWWQSTSVTENLFQTPKKFEFIQAIRLLRHVPFRLNQRRWASHFYFGTSLELGFMPLKLSIWQKKMIVSNWSI